MDGSESCQLLGQLAMGLEATPLAGPAQRTLGRWGGRPMSVLRVAILVCTRCGTEVKRTRPFPPEHVARVLAATPFLTMRCPNGCSSNVADLYNHTRVTVHDAIIATPLDPAPL